MTYQIDIRIEVDKVEVDPDFFKFKYKVFINKKLIHKGNYDSSHSHRGDVEMKKFKTELENGWAAQVILESLKLPQRGS
jgi:hypothetical protein